MTTPVSTTAIRNLHERPLREWPTELRPTERLYQNGASALSDAEVLAIILGNTGSHNALTLASSLIVSFGGWHGLHRASISELAQHPGMNRQRAASIKAAFEIWRRMLLVVPSERWQIRSPADAAQLLIAEMAHLDQEHFRVMLLDTKNRVEKIQTVYIGTLNSATIRVAEVFKEAIRLNAASVILAHNHPSGECSPSPEDVAVTRQIVEAGRLLDIDVLDHLIIGQGRYVSLRERGLGFA